LAADSSGSLRAIIVKSSETLALSLADVSRKSRFSSDAYACASCGRE
jgi:hypothetical protein